mgnify:CR=1 FL=1
MPRCKSRGIIFGMCVKMKYSKSFNVIPTNLTKGEAIDLKFYSRIQIEPSHPSYIDANHIFSQERFKYPYLPLYLGNEEIDPHCVNLNVLRLIIRENNVNAKICIPKELSPLTDFCLKHINYHHQFYPANTNCFIYLTIRVTDDECYYKNSQTWHIDGFQGSKLTRHIPEQTILWSNTNPTEFSIQPYFLEGLNPSKHNIHKFFHDNAFGPFYKGIKNGTYLLTPYNVHRVSNEEFKGRRLFVRLTFSPVEIEDYTNTFNPMMEKFTYPTREDVRDFFWDYQGENTEGFELLNFRLEADK